MKGLATINYITLAIFFILLAVLLFIIVKHLMRFMGFYVIRRDYQRIKTLGGTLAKQSSSSNTVNSYTGSFSKLSMRQKIQVYKEQLVFSLLAYHPVLSLAFSKVRGLQGYLKLPLWVSLGIFLLTFSTLTALALALAKANMSIC